MSCRSVLGLVRCLEGEVHRARALNRHQLEAKGYCQNSLSIKKGVRLRSLATNPLLAMGGGTVCRCEKSFRNLAGSPHWLNGEYELSGVTKALALDRSLFYKKQRIKSILPDLPWP